MPLLILSALFDALRFMCEWFGLFGPGIVSIVTTGALSGWIGTWLAGIVGGLVGIATGFLLGAVFTFIGVVLAAAIGLIGAGVLGLLLLLFNPRIFKVRPGNWLWLGFGTLGSVVPFVGSMPFLTGVLWSLYRSQIKHERALRKEWASTQTNALEEQAARAYALRALREAAGDNEEIPALSSQAA